MTRTGAIRACGFVIGICLALPLSACTENEEPSSLEPGNEVEFEHAGPLAPLAEDLSRRFDVSVIAPTELPTANGRMLEPAAGLRVNLAGPASGVVLAHEEQTRPEPHTGGTVLLYGADSSLTGVQGCGKFLWYVDKGLDNAANDWMERVGNLLVHKGRTCTNGWGIIS